MENLIFWALILTASPISHSQASVGSATGCYKLGVNIPTSDRRLKQQSASHRGVHLHVRKKNAGRGL